MKCCQYDTKLSQLGVNGREFTRVVLVSIVALLLRTGKHFGYMVRCLTGKTSGEKERDMGCRDISNFGK